MDGFSPKPFTLRRLGLLTPAQEMAYQHGSGGGGLRVQAPFHRTPDYIRRPEEQLKFTNEYVRIPDKYITPLTDHVYRFSIHQFLNSPEVRKPGYLPYGFGRITVRNTNHVTLRFNDYMVFDTSYGTTAQGQVPECPDSQGVTFPTIYLKYGNIMLYLLTDKIEFKERPVVYMNLVYIPDKFYHPDQFISTRFKYNGMWLSMQYGKVIAVSPSRQQQEVFSR